MVKIMKKILVGIMLLLSFSASAEELKFIGLRAYDGDTIRTPIVALKGLPKLSIRVQGIDTPEIRGKCDSEKIQALKARDRLNQLLDGEVTVIPIEWDKYGGRFIAKVLDKDGRNVSDILITEGLARPYQGEKKQPWCPVTQ